MRLCILCDDSKVEQVRKKAGSIMGGRVMEKAASPTGENPATHWFCFVTVTQEGYDRLMSLKEHSIMEESGPKEFLEKWNLKIIK
jgi:hypothetical protein